MKIFHILPFLALVAACTTQQSQNGNIPFGNEMDSNKTNSITTENPLPEVNTTVYNKIKAIIDTTREYKEAVRVIDSATKHKQSVSFLVEPNENSRDSVFSVNVGHNRSDRFEKFFTWQVDVKNRQITCVDAISGQTLSLDEYRRRNQENGFPW